MVAVNETSAKSRKNILAKLKAQVAGADYDKLPDEPTFAYPDIPHEQCVSKFVDNLTLNHAEIIEVSEQTVASVIEQQLKKRDIGQLLYGANGKHAAMLEGYFNDDASTGIKLEQYDFLLTDNKARLFDHCPASFTSSKCSIAATGTIVLWPTVAEPRTLSLVPPVHFVLVDANDMVSDFATLIKTQQWADKLPTNALLISGPSKTADIQQTLAYGAHGPKELIVLLLNS
ncbi:LutC/YkgG family protein [Thalassotalea sp. PLHSN55]|uniref:LutC/YkgG family protein n=1 Tax=Thalassotalea sp. PLHSN55 TaxID=3435888 RepID=UPI003F87F082